MGIVPGEKLVAVPADHGVANHVFIVDCSHFLVQEDIFIRLSDPFGDFARVHALQRVRLRGGRRYCLDTQGTPQAPLQ